MRARPANVLLFRLGAVRLCADAAGVRAVLREVRPRSLLGRPVFEHAGRVWPLVPLAETGPILVLQAGAGCVGCRVEEVLGLAAPDAGDWRETPAPLPRRVFPWVLACGGRLWLLCDPPGLQGEGGRDLLAGAAAWQETAGSARPPRRCNRPLSPPAPSRLPAAAPRRPATSPRPVAPAPPPVRSAAADGRRVESSRGPSERPAPERVWPVPPAIPRGARGHGPSPARPEAPAPVAGSSAQVRPARPASPAPETPTAGGPASTSGAWLMSVVAACLLLLAVAVWRWGGYAGPTPLPVGGGPTAVAVPPRPGENATASPPAPPPARAAVDFPGRAEHLPARTAQTLTEPPQTTPAATLERRGRVVTLRLTEPAPDAASEAPDAVERRRIEHVVVRGDTLWDIAGRYLENPFRYPELARLSRIRDPDLIYPGDRVVIVLHRQRAAGR